LVSLIAGVMLMVTGVARLGRVVAMVPHSIVVGFTIGIAVVIAFSQMGEILGYESKIGYGLDEQIENIFNYAHEFNAFASIVAISTFVICRISKRISPFLPGPLVALSLAFLAADTFWSEKGLVLIKDKYGSIPTDFLVFTMPVLPANWNAQVMFDLVYYVVAIYFVAAVESLLCSRMADRLAGNTGVPYNPNKELWGQGLVNMITPLFNGFPHTGALARTAVSIKLGAVSPLAGIAKFSFKLLLAAFLATYLEEVPMACIGGILLYVAFNMIKAEELKEVISTKSNIHLLLMVYTALMVPFFGFLTAVLSAIGIHIVLNFMTRNRIIRKLDEVRLISRVLSYFKK
jgi:MFS superfamily sulfate permease-like transporter